MPTKSKGQTLPLCSRESFTRIILKTSLCLTLGFQGMHIMLAAVHIAFDDHVDPQHPERAPEDKIAGWLSFMWSYKHHQPWSLVVEMCKHVTSHCQVPCSCSKVYFNVTGKRAFLTALTWIEVSQSCEVQPNPRHSQPAEVLPWNIPGCWWILGPRSAKNFQRLLLYITVQSPMPNSLKPPESWDK